MTKRIFSLPTLTPTAQADGVLAAGSYAAIKGGSSTQIVTILEVYQAGQSAASAYNATCLAFASTLETTPTALALPNTLGYLNPNAGALSSVEIPFVAANTAPTRASATTLPRMRLGFNAFGGVVRWVAAPGEEWVQFGNSTNGGETTFSSENYGTAGAQAVNFIYEVT